MLPQRVHRRGRFLLGIVLAAGIGFGPSHGEGMHGQVEIGQLAEKLHGLLGRFRESIAGLIRRLDHFLRTARLVQLVQQRGISHGQFRVEARNGGIVAGAAVEHLDPAPVRGQDDLRFPRLFRPVGYIVQPNREVARRQQMSRAKP